MPLAGVGRLLPYAVISRRRTRCLPCCGCAVSGKLQTGFTSEDHRMIRATSGHAVASSLRFMQQAEVRSHDLQDRPATAVVIQIGLCRTFAANAGSEVLAAAVARCRSSSRLRKKSTKSSTSAWRCGGRDLSFSRRLRVSRALREYNLHCRRLERASS